MDTYWNTTTKGFHYIIYYSKLVRCVRERKNIDLTSVPSTIIFIFCIRYTTLTLKNSHSLYRYYTFPFTAIDLIGFSTGKWIFTFVRDVDWCFPLDLILTIFLSLGLSSILPLYLFHGIRFLIAHRMYFYGIQFIFILTYDLFWDWLNIFTCNLFIWKFGLLTIVTPNLVKLYVPTLVQKLINLM